MMMDMTRDDPETKKRIQALVDHRLRDLHTELEETLGELHECSESPIERIMAARLLFVGYGYGRSSGWNRTWVYGLNDGPGGKGPYIGDCDIVIVPQAEIGAFRVDFVLLFRVGEKLARYVIECDGHDFHERTKEQAAKDKKRDRVLQSMGYQVFRYTGSEIWRNADDLLGELELSLMDYYEEAQGIPRRQRK